MSSVIICLAPPFIILITPRLQVLTAVRIEKFSAVQEKTGDGSEHEENYFFRVTEAIFVGWFTLEYLIRFIVSPYKVK